MPKLHRHSESMPVRAPLLCEKIKLSGLIGSLELNGKFGEAIDFDNAVGRYKIKLESDGKQLFFHPRNVFHADDPDMLPPCLSDPSESKSGQAALSFDEKGYDSRHFPVWHRFPSWLETGDDGVERLSLPLH